MSAESSFIINLDLGVEWVDVPYSKVNPSVTVAHIGQAGQSISPVWPLESWVLWKIWAEPEFRQRAREFPQCSLRARYDMFPHYCLSAEIATYQKMIRGKTYCSPDNALLLRRWIFTDKNQIWITMLPSDIQHLSCLQKSLFNVFPRFAGRRAQRERVQRLQIYPGKKSDKSQRTGKDDLPLMPRCISEQYPSFPIKLCTLTGCAYSI